MFALGAVLFLLLAGHPSGAPALIAKTSPLRVMAFGDSITAGLRAAGMSANDGGYRGYLAQALDRAGYRITFVGSRTDFSGTIVQRAHEGWPGYVVRSFPSDPGPGQLYGALTQKAMQEDDPDLVLLMAGTNDLLRHERGLPGYTLCNIVTSMDLLIEEIVTAKPGVFVIVAPVVDSPNVGTGALRQFAGLDRGDCDAEGGGVKAVVERYQQRGYRVSFADEMAVAVPRDPQHFPDGIHPFGPGGYAAIAEVWFRAIEAITRTGAVPAEGASP